MIKFIDTYALKKKFATFLSQSYYSGFLTLQQINEAMIFDKRMNFLEDENIEWFMNTQIDSLESDLFGIDLFFVTNDTNPVYWAGLQYISISLNGNIPLNQLFLLCPLDEMVSHYNIYHEMNTILLYEEFISNEYQRSIVKRVREERNLTVKELSLLTNISINTLKYYEKSNKNLFNSTMNNISSLAFSLKVDISLLKQESNFIPLSLFLCNDKDFLNNLSIDLSKLLNLDSISIKQIINKDEINMEPNTLYIGSINVISINQKKYYIDDLKLISIIKNSIKKIVKENKENQLYYWKI